MEKKYFKTKELAESLVKKCGTGVKSFAVKAYAKTKSLAKSVVKRWNIDVLKAVRVCLPALCLALICVAGIALKGDNSAAEETVQTTAPSVTTTAAATTTTTTTTEYREEVVLEHPYLIQVDKTAQVVSVYTTNEEGKYEKLVRQMICSTGVLPKSFLDGMYKLSKTRWEWRTMLSKRPMHAQYATVISGDFLFHSVPYSLFGHNDTLYMEEFKMLGTPRSGGCIRLTVEGAKWIFENCPAGTPVCIMTGDVYDEALIESLRPPEPVDGWDLTDPHPDNPDYHPLITEPDPQPDKYAPLYEYDWIWGPVYDTVLTGTRVRTTTTQTTATVSSTVATAPTEGE